jgi:hypothetical protein
MSYKRYDPLLQFYYHWMMAAQHVSSDEAVQIHIDVQSKKSIGTRTSASNVCKIIAPEDTLSTVIKKETRNYILTRQRLVVPKCKRIFSYSG